MFRPRRFRSRRVRQERRTRLLLQILLWTAVALGVLLLFVQASRLPQFRIERIAIMGAETTSRQEIFDVASETLRGRYLYLFPYNNILIFPRKAVADTLLDAFPRLKRVDTNFVRRGEIEISVAEREPVGVVCSPRSLRGASDEVCYFLDQTGFMFAPAPVFSDNALFVYRQDGVVGTIGRYFLDAQLFSETLLLREALRELGLFPTAFTANIRSTDVFARNFTFTLKEGTSLIFSADQTQFETEVQNLQTILRSPEFRAESGGEIGTVEYIDLRFGNKVFYRLE